MKILLINKWVAGATPGPFYYPGTWRDTFELAFALTDLGQKVEILTTKVQNRHFNRFQKEFGNRLSQKGIELHFARTFVTFGRDFGSFRLRMFLDELSVIRSFKPDVIQYMQFGPSLIYPFTGKIPIVYYSCDQFEHYPKEEEDRRDAVYSWQKKNHLKILIIFQNLLFFLLAKLWGSLVLKDALQKDAIFILKHPRGYKNLKAKFTSKSKIFLVTKGVTLNKFQPAKKRGANFLNLLFMGMITNRKGVFDLLKAVQIIKKKQSNSTSEDPNIKLLVAGTGPSVAVARLKRQVADLKINATYLGPVSFTSRLKILSSADIFCLPSYQDSYPSVILEAMAMGVPVVSTTEIDSPIVDGASGLLVNAGNVESLVGAIEKLVNNSNLRYKIGEAAKIAVKDLTWSNQAAKLISLYQKILSA